MDGARNVEFNHTDNAPPMKHWTKCGGESIVTHACRVNELLFEI